MNRLMYFWRGKRVLCARKTLVLLSLSLSLHGPTCRALKHTARKRHAETSVVPSLLLLIMPFLIPAVVALASDAVILWLHRYVVDKLSFADDEGVDHKEECKTLQYSSTFHSFPSRCVSHSCLLLPGVFRLGYLVPLGVLRLILLLLPLLYHSYNGTALRFLGAYQVLYGGTLCVVFLHSLALLLLYPASLETLVPADTHEMKQLEHFHALRVIWWMLLLTVVSTICHVVVLGHVKSSAPSYAVTAAGNKAQPSLYFALRFGRGSSRGDPQEEEPALVHAVNGTCGSVFTLVCVARV